MRIIVALAFAVSVFAQDDEPCEKYASYEIQQSYDADANPIELAEMFANGEGVTRDLDAAIHFICAAVEIAPMEASGMIEHVEKMRRGETSDPLKYCDHITGGRGAYWCALEHQTEIEPKLAARFDAVRNAAGDATKALDALRERADLFVDEHANSASDINRGGTIYPSVVVWNHVHGEDVFLDTLERYSRERASAAMPADAKRADVDLNATYRKRLAEIAECEWCNKSEPTETENLRSAQRLWISYRDAWIAYYIERWRGVAPPETLKREILAQLTRDRVAQLVELAQ